jgi:cytochrome c oxidase subunit III
MSQAGNHPSHLEHHFTDSEQQHESAKLGMWIFLITEVLLFGGLFVAYAVFRSLNPDMFYQAHKFLNLKLGATNTFVLITSSVTMVLAVRAMEAGNKRATLINLYFTLLLATIFLIIKFFEYSHKFELGQLPGKFYTFKGVPGTNPHIFFGIYFAMTGLHAVHVIGGMSIITWIAIRTQKGQFSPAYYTPLELTGLYWHLVDIIWIYLFPMLYLIG